MGSSHGCSKAKGGAEPGGLGDVANRVAERMGKIPLSGRYHRSPAKITDSYSSTKTVLGQGMNGEVFLANGLGDKEGQKFAVKAFKLDRIPQSEKAELEAEVEIFLTLDHPHIARLIDVFETPDYLHLVMECLEGGELFDRVSELKKFSEKDAAEATHQMLLAVNYLHTTGIVHRDLKLENFLYDVKGSTHLKLIDFGFSKIWDVNTKMKMSCGTLSYVAPEVLKKAYTSQCDLWSLGVITFILLVGYMPFHGNQDTQIRAIQAGKYNYKADKWSKVSAQGKEFMEKLLTVDAKERMTALQALDHPWMANRSGLEDKGGIDESVINGFRNFGQASKLKRACMSMMAWSLTNEQRAEVRKHFLAMDKNNEGTITAAEFRQVLVEQYNIENSEVTRIFETMDSNNDELIHYADFLAAMVSSRIEMHDGMIRAAFKRFDVDNSGFITPENMREMLGDTHEDAKVEELIAEADTNKDGKISYEELVAYLRGDAAHSSHQDAAELIIDAQAKGSTPPSMVQRM